MSGVAQRPEKLEGWRMAKLQWGILGTGQIASTFARGVAASQTGQLVAVGSRTQESADRFAREFGLARAHGSYEALIGDPEVSAIYVATPHPQHLEWTVRAARAGKHVLCEKPLAMNRSGAATMIEAARAFDVLLMEAYMYRCHPQTAKAVDLVKSGALGRIGMIQATFSYCNEFDPGSRIWNKAQGGGGILDVGGYPVSFARLIAGAATGKAFADPVSVAGAGCLHPRTDVDVHAAALLQFPDDIVAQVACGCGLLQDNSVRIYGSKGWLHVPDPWVPNREGGTATIYLHRNNAAAPEEIRITAPPLYALEADAFAAALAAGRREVPQMTAADTLGNMAVLDRWREAIGLAYDADKM
jgi:predicted dehydrogenase